MKNKGITLIALVITIIILLILAGISIATLTGSGLFNKTQIAVEKYKIESAREKLELSIYKLTINKQKNIELSELNEINQEDIEIKTKQDGSVEIYTENNKNYALAKVDGYYFKIYDDMTVEFFRELTPEETEKLEYIKDGLVVWYDGINNTRTGHSDTTNIWENLVEDANNGTLKNIDFNNVSGWTDNSLILDGVNDWVQMSYLYYDNMTIEIVAKPVDNNYSKTQHYLANVENGGLGIYKNSNNRYSGQSYSQSAGTYKGASSEEDIRIGQMYSLSASYNGTKMYFSENGKIYEADEPGLQLKPEDSTVYAIGTNPEGKSEVLTSGGDRANIEVYSVRIYNRALSEEEIKHNYQVDKERFNIEKLPEEEELGYVKDGLVCLYDGKQNTKYGHSKKTNIWHNLNGTINMNLKNINHTSKSGWTENSLILDGSNDWAILDTFMHYSNMTIEMALKPLAVKGTESTQYSEYYIANIEVGGIALCKYKGSNKIGVSAYIGGDYKAAMSNNAANVGTIYSLSTGYNGSELYFRENGDIYKTAVTGSFGKPDDSTRFALATNPEGSTEALTSGAVRSNIEVYSVRIYNRCLTEEEIQTNYLIDKQRFNIE